MVVSTQQTLQSSTHLANQMPKKQRHEMPRSAPSRHRSKASFLLLVVPWAILIAERVIGTLNFARIKSAENELSSFFPPSRFTTSSTSVIPLEVLTRSNNKEPSCPVNQTAVMDRPLPLSQITSPNRKIPKIIHQTSLRRCLVDEIVNVTDTWRNFDNGWAYYFHDDVAVDALFAKNWPEFPHLQEVAQCILYGAVKADLWRYLVLWEYGGLYSDIDASPAVFNTSTITDDDDGFFVVEHSDLLSQYFLALSPRHPLMYYAIQESLSNILREKDVGYINTPLATGPQALHEAFTVFMADVGVTVPFYGHGNAVAAGFFQGTNNRSIRVVGSGKFQDEYILREAIDRRPKKKLYKTMNMTYFMDRQRNGRSCMSVLFEARNSSLFR